MSAIVRHYASILATCFIVLWATRLYAQERIKLYALYTPSHKKFLDEWFLPSLQDDIELKITCYDQECPDGAFMKRGWRKTMLHKVELVLQAIEENWGQYFIHCDVDIQFFAPIRERIDYAMHGYDMVFQRDNLTGSVCAGFFACRGNERTRGLWQEIRRRLIETLDSDDESSRGIQDQTILNTLIRGKNPFGIQWRFLPESFFGGGTFSGKRWKPGMNLHVPEHPVMHHANFAVGIEDKLAQLEFARNKVATLRLCKSLDNVTCHVAVAQ